MSALLKLVPNEKACTKCDVVKPFSEFDKQRNGIRPQCKNCRHISYKNARGNAPDGRKKIVLVEDGRICMTCEQPKSWDKFSKDVHGYNQKTATCSDCRNEKGREVYKTNPAVRRSGIKNRPDRLKKFYGITFADVVRTFDAQHGMCANHACGREITLETKSDNRGMKNKAMIDHNHTTRKFRALLCMQCNLTLGYLEKQENVILGLQDYLTKHQTLNRS